MAWYRDRAALRLIALGYLPWLAGLNLAWEVGQLPLYTLWREGSPAWIAFSVAHCTAGDVLIGASALAAALVLTGAREIARWRWGLIAAVATVLATVYTGFSEWVNAGLAQNWQYTERMPVLRVGPATVGLAPLAQWLVLPALALRLARTRIARPVGSPVAGGWRRSRGLR
jgi:hypothetical protein